MTTHIQLSAETINHFVAEATERLKENHKSWADYVTHVKFVVDVPSDIEPNSEQFLKYQLDLWRTISARSIYDPIACETNDYIASDISIQTTYPFSSQHPQEIGSYFLGVANIVQKLPVPVGSRIVEFGVGYGHLTRMLANIGYTVEAVDIESRFLELLPKLALPGAQPIYRRHMAFADADYEAASVDAFIFYECFHHCLDFASLVRKMRQALKPGGCIIFAAEAFYDDWFDFPWGVRLDGHSVWAIRNFGWMELGFRKSYIGNFLTEEGLTLDWSSLTEAGAYGELLIARLT